MSTRISAASMVRLESALGEKLAKFTFDPGNTGEVRRVLQELMDATLNQSEWWRLFGHLYTWENDFNEINFPLDGDGDDAEVQEFAFGSKGLISGHEALAQFKEMGLRPAGLRAIGRYIKANPDAQKKHPLVGIGANFSIPRGGYEYIPLFSVDAHGHPDVDLRGLVAKLNMEYRFLLYKRNCPIILGEIILAGETYEVLSVLRQGESVVKVEEVKNRFNEWRASDSERMRTVLENNFAAATGKFIEKYFVFCNETNGGWPGRVAIVSRFVNESIPINKETERELSNGHVFLRRKQAANQEP